MWSGTVFPTRAAACWAALLAGRWAAVALPVPLHVRWRTLVYTLVLVQEEGLLAAQAVAGVPSAGSAARRTVPTHLVQRETPGGRRQMSGRRRNNVPWRNNGG